MKKVDYLIIGAGLAGTILADFLSEKATVLLLDKEAGKYGSKVAAGIYNPVTGRRMVKSWMVDSFAPFALNYYKKVENKFHCTLIDEIDIDRLFHNSQQRQEWLERVDFDQLENIIKSQIEPEPENMNWFKEHGGVKTTSSWRLDTSAFLGVMHNKWRESKILQNTEIAYSDIKAREGAFIVNDVKAMNIVFCEGWKIKENPWFSHLPIRPNKGELLTVKAEGLNVKDLVQKRIFVLPVGNNTFKVGATYDRENHDYLPTTNAKKWLVERLENIIKVPYSIVEQKVGIRPASIDRRPFVGTHPIEKNMFVFNGFGSKGVHQMPWCASHFVDVLINKVPVNSEMDVKRFEKKDPMNSYKA